MVGADQVHRDRALPMLIKASFEVVVMEISLFDAGFHPFRGFLLHETILAVGEAVELRTKPHELLHRYAAQLVFHLANDFGIVRRIQRVILAVVAEVEPSGIRSELVVDVALGFHHVGEAVGIGEEQFG